MIFSKYWTLDYKKVLISYVILSFTLSFIEYLLTGTFQWSFIITYIGLFFVSPHIRRAINAFFKAYHIKKVVRNLLEPWILFGLIFLYVQVFFIFHYLTYNVYIGFDPIAQFIFFLLIIILILISINPLIRIVAVAFHRRKSDLFPINRIEFAAMKCLSQENNIKFDKLINRIRGTLNIFIPEVYFTKEIAFSSIYHLCGIRFADINEDHVVSLNEKGKEQFESWNKTLTTQTKRYNKILNRKGILIKSFIGLLILSLLKIAIGSFSSQSLRAEGIENFLDCIAIVLIGIGIKYKKEKLVNIILVILMSFAAGTIIFESVISLISGPDAVEVPFIVVFIAIVSIFLNTYLRALKNFIGKKNRNSSLVTSAIDSKVNIIISIGIILGALLSEFGKSQGFTFLYYFDPIIAIIVSYFIFREVVEIIIVFIKGKDDDIEFEKFQMPYEKNFEEYIVKWILSVYTDHPNEEFTLNSLEETFQHSLTKGKEIYTALSHFGLYIFNDNGISSVIKSLVDESILIETKSNNIKISQRGIYLYENFYSKPLLEDIKDPFDFFFEVDYDFDSIRHRKSDIMESYAKKGEN